MWRTVVVVVEDGVSCSAALGELHGVPSEVHFDVGKRMLSMVKLRAISKAVVEEKS